MSTRSIINIGKDIIRVNDIKELNKLYYQISDIDL